MLSNTTLGNRIFSFVTTLSEFLFPIVSYAFLSVGNAYI